MELKAHVQTPFIRLKTGEAVALGLCQGKVGSGGLDSDGEGWRRCFCPSVLRREVPREIICVAEQPGGANGPDLGSHQPARQARRGRVSWRPHSSATQCLVGGGRSLVSIRPSQAWVPDTVTAIGRAELASDAG